MSTQVSDLEADRGGTSVTESHESGWIATYLRIVERFIPRDKQLRAGMHKTLERVKLAAESPLTSQLVQLV